MSSGLQATKRRMASIQSTQKITKAMELVATAKLKTWKDAMVENAAFTSSILQLMDEVFSRVENVDSPFLKENESERDLYIVLSSSLGLCGGYNYNVFRFADQLIGEDDDIMVIGSKGYYHYRNRLDHVLCDYLDENGHLTEQFINSLAARLERDFVEGKYRKISLIYTQYVNSLTFIPRELIIFPLSLNKKEDSVLKDIIMEPSPKAILLSFIPFYLRSILYGKFLEATVSEHASRRTAMENATDNAEEIFQQLQLEFNKERQALITQEITEVVGGASNK